MLNEQKLSQVCKRIADAPRFPRRAHYVNLTRGKLKIAVAIAPGLQHGFIASGSIGRSRPSAWGATPEKAVLLLAKYIDGILCDLQDREMAVA